MELDFISTFIYGGSYSSNSSANKNEVLARERGFIFCPLAPKSFCCLVCMFHLNLNTSLEMFVDVTGDSWL